MSMTSAAAAAMVGGSKMLHGVQAGCSTACADAQAVSSGGSRNGLRPRLTNIKLEILLAVDYYI